MSARLRNPPAAPRCVNAQDQATGAEAPPSPDRAAYAVLHRDYLASRIEASVAPPGRVLTVLPTVFLALLLGAVGSAWWGHVDINPVTVHLKSRDSSLN